MAVYSVLVRSSAERELARIPQHDLRRIKTKLLALADNPTPPGCTKLADEKLFRLSRTIGELSMKWITHRKRLKL